MFTAKYELGLQIRYSFFLKGLSITEYFRMNRYVLRKGETFYLINFILKLLGLWQIFFINKVNDLGTFFFPSFQDG